MLTDVYRLSDQVYVISNDGGWFAEGTARYGGRGKGQHISLSTWVIDVTAEPQDKEGRIVLSRQNLQEFFWEQHNPADLVQIPRATAGTGGGSYFEMRDKATPFITLVTPGRTYSVMLTQE